MGVKQGDAVSSDVSLLSALPTPVPLVRFSSWRFLLYLYLLSGRNLFFLYLQWYNLTFSYLLKKFPLWNSSRVEENHLIGIRQTIYLKKTKSYFLYLLSVSRIRNYDLKKNQRELVLIAFHAISEFVSSQQPSMVSTHYILKKKKTASIKL